MSDDLEARAQELLDVFVDVEPHLETEYFLHAITTALREERRRVWGEAAQYCRAVIALSPGERLKHYEDMADECEARAQQEDV